MANKPIDMKKLRAVLRLHSKEHSQRDIAKSCGLSRNTVIKYIELYKHLGLDRDQIEQMDDESLSELFTFTLREEPNPRLQTLKQFFPYMQKELRKTGVTRKLLWEEYRRDHRDGFMLTQFCEHYSRWIKRVDPIMHIEYKA